MGPTYYGTVQPGNTGPNSGNNTPTEPVTTYTGPTAVAPDAAAALTLNICHNPLTGNLLYVSSN